MPSRVVGLAGAARSRPHTFYVGRSRSAWLRLSSRVSWWWWRRRCFALVARFSPRPPWVGWSFRRQRAFAGWSSALFAGFLACRRAGRSPRSLLRCFASGPWPLPPGASFPSGCSLRPPCRPDLGRPTNDSRNKALDCRMRSVSLVCPRPDRFSGCPLNWGTAHVSHPRPPVSTPRIR